MDFTEIMNYLEQGFTLEQIKQIQEKNTQNQQNQPAQQNQQNQQAQQNQSAPAAQQNQPASSAENTPEWVNALNASITKLTHTIQANALSNTSINAPKDIQAQTDDILANIINPTKTGGNT